MRYCLLSFAAWEPRFANEFAKQEIPLSGLFNWSILFNGDRAFPRAREEFEKYNLLHVNITANNMNLIPKLLRQIDREKVKLVFNVDYAIELWGANLRFPEMLWHILDMADYLFAVEEQMAQIMSMALTRNVACIPHPVNIEALKKLRTTERLPLIGALHHGYDGNIVLPSIAINEAIAELRPKWRSAALGGVATETSYGHLYDHFVPAIKDFAVYAKLLSEYYAIIESYTMHSYGRTTIECAAMGVPVIGSDLVSSQRRCFPQLATGTNDIAGAARRLKELIKNPEYWTAVTKTAMAEAEYYSFENCEKMMLDLLNGGD